MATSLRTLLDKPSEEDLTLDEGTAPRWQIENVNTQMFASSYGQERYCTCYDNTCWCNFCIDSSMDIITFELWGGGGGGAGGCCCSWGVPGGAGAYTKLVINNTDNAYNQCITMCVAPSSCCSSNSCCGYRGCRTYITSSNFICGLCAEGGQPGCGFCNFFNCFPNNCCGILEHPCNINCACYYGCATGNPDGNTVCATGIAGKYGWLQTDCYSPSDFCWYKVAFPIPGGLGTTDVAYHVIRAYCNTGTERDQCRVGGWANSNAIGGGYNGYLSVGKGGSTARVCGGGCCCGWPGGPGLIKISWT